MSPLVVPVGWQVVIDPTGENGAETRYVSTILTTHDNVKKRRIVLGGNSIEKQGL